MKKVFEVNERVGYGKFVSFSVFLKKNGGSKSVFTDSNDKKHIAHYKDADSISCPIYNKEAMLIEIEKNMGCRVFNVSYTESKRVRAGFGGERIATKRIKLKNVSEFELIYYRDKPDFEAIEIV